MISTLYLLAALATPQVTARIPLEAPPAEQQSFLDGPVTLALYDVEDLVNQMAAVWSEELQSLDPVASEKLKERKREIGKELLGGIREHIKPAFTKGQNQVQLEASKALAFSGTASQHAWVSAFLAAHRGIDRYVRINTHLLEGPRDVFKDKKSPGNRFFEKESQIRDFLEGLRQTPNVETVTAPSVTTAPGTKASIATTNEVAYVASWKVHVVEPGGQEIADPEIAVIQEGVIIDLRIVPVPPQATQDSSGAWAVNGELGYSLTIEVENSEIERPIETRKVRLNSNADGREVEISVPSVSRISLVAEVLMTKGAGLLIGGPSTDDERDVAILIHLPEGGPMLKFDPEDQ